jgi:hypothetical protein
VARGVSERFRRPSARVLRAVGVVLAAKIAVAAIEKLEHGGDVRWATDVMAHGIAHRIGGLRIAVLDELIALGIHEAELGHTTVAIEQAKLEALVMHEGGAVETSLDTHPGPAAKLAGDLIDEGGRVRHGPIVSAWRLTPAARRLCNRYRLLARRRRRRRFEVLQGVAFGL